MTVTVILKSKETTTFILPRIIQTHTSEPFAVPTTKLTSASSSSGQSRRATGSTASTGDPPVIGLETLPVTYFARSYTQSVPLSSPHTRMHDTEFNGEKKKSNSFTVSH